MKLNKEDGLNRFHSMKSDKDMRLFLERSRRDYLVGRWFFVGEGMEKQEVFPLKNHNTGEVAKDEFGCIMTQRKEDGRFININPFALVSEEEWNRALTALLHGEV